MDELNSAIDHLRTGDIHKTRTGIKRMRALLNLAACASGDVTAKTQACTLRDAGRNLAELRDVEVSLATLAKLEASVKAPEQSVFRIAREIVGAPQNPAGADTEAALQRLELVRTVMGGWLPNADWRSIRSDLQRSYRRSRNALKKAQRSKPHKAAPKHLRDPEVMHLVRKRLKLLWAQLCLLCACSPHTMKYLACKLEKITERLGSEHDLFILRQRLEYAGPNPIFTPLLQMIDKRRAKLDQAALDLAKRFLAEKPSTFVNGLF